MDRITELAEIQSLVDQQQISAALSRITVLAGAYPNDFQVQLMLAATLIPAGRLQEAGLAIEQAVQHAPTHAAVTLTRHNLAVALYQRGEFDLAVQTHYQNLLQFPEHIPGYRDLAQGLIAQGEVAQGYEILQAACERFPDDRETRFAFALAALRLEKWAEGWPAYEARWTEGELAQRLPPQGQLWQPGERPQYLQILPEQGLGDHLMFARYLAHLEGLADHLHCVVPGPLRTLFAHSFPHIHFTQAAPTGEQTRYLSLASLPNHLLEQCPQPPSNWPYLRPNPAALSADLQSLLALLPQPFLAITWRGNQSASHLASRSLQLADILPAIPTPFMDQADGPHVVSIQKDPSEDEQALLAKLGILDLSPALTDFNATAAILALSDAVLSIDTAVVHLAGALDKPIILLQRPEGDWRWGADHQGRAWYREVHPVIIQRH